MFLPRLQCRRWLGGLIRPGPKIQQRSSRRLVGGKVAGALQVQAGKKSALREVRGHLLYLDEYEEVVVLGSDR